jgi:hypothetical protein
MVEAPELDGELFGRCWGSGGGIPRGGGGFEKALVLASGSTSAEIQC